MRNYIKRIAWYKGTDCSTKSELSADNNQLLNLRVRITNQTMNIIPPSLEEADESYTLNSVLTDTIEIVASQYSGAMRGLATFVQLVE